MKIDTKLETDIREYCKLNGLKPIDFVDGIIRKGFMTEKYGDKPMFGGQLKKTAMKKTVYYTFSLPVVEKNEQKNELLTDTGRKIRNTRKLT